MKYNLHMLFLWLWKVLYWFVNMNKSLPELERGKQRYYWCHRERKPGTAPLADEWKTNYVDTVPGVRVISIGYCWHIFWSTPVECWSSKLTIYEPTKLLPPICSQGSSSRKIPKLSGFFLWGEICSWSQILIERTKNSQKITYVSLVR